MLNGWWDDEDEALEGPGFSVHPSLIIKDILNERKITISGLATHLGVARPGFNNMLNGNRALTGALASKIGDALDYPGELLATMMARHDFAMASADAKNHVERFVLA